MDTTDSFVKNIVFIDSIWTDTIDVPTGDRKHPFMEHTKNRKEILLEEINELNHLIEEARTSSHLNRIRSAKDCAEYRRKLAELIVELSNLPHDKN